MTICRYHGARRPNTILKGEAHPGYKSGHETLAAKAARAAEAAEMRELEKMMHLLNMTTAKKTPGRKPKADATPRTLATLELTTKLCAPKG